MKDLQPIIVSKLIFVLGLNTNALSDVFNSVETK